MASDGFSYQQREGVAPSHGPFVQTNWPEGATFGPVQSPQAIHFGPISQDDGSRPVSHGDMAWSGFRSDAQGQYQQIQGHNPFCHQHGRPEGEQPIPGHASCCPQHHQSAVPPAVPTPPPSDGSPHPAWMPPVHPDAESQHQAKRVKYDWGFDVNAPILRPDGVRKKNAKFDIPEERNLTTLDSLIKHAKSEGELKELKMQKRLLRNREAALHSRQKKKSHTEWLERERDSLYNKMLELQDTLTNLRIQADDHEREKSGLEDRLTNANEQVQALQREKQELLGQQERERRKFRQETARMREVLQQQKDSLATGSPTSASTQVSAYTLSSNEESVAFSQAAGGFEGDWEGGYDFMNDTCLDPGKLRQDGGPGAGNILVH